MITRYGLPLLALALLGFAVFYVRAEQKPEPAVPPPAVAPRSPYSHNVAGTGMVEPQTESIAIGTQMPGIVVEVFVQVNQQVQAGDPLFRLDDRELRATLKLRQAALAQAQSSLTRLKNLPRSEDRPVAAAKVAEAEANVADKLALFQRVEALRAKSAVSEEESISRKHAFETAKAQLDFAQAQLELLEAGTWKYDMAVAEQAVLHAQAEIDQVQTDLDRLTVRALVDAEVLQVNVRPGEYVGITSGQAYVMLGNVQKLHVRVSIDEHDIPRYPIGAKARALLKGTPGIEYPLTFVRVEPFVVPKKSLTGENTERVDTRVLQVIYSVDSQPERLYVGQQVDVFIDAKTDAAP